MSTRFERFLSDFSEERTMRMVPSAVWVGLAVLSLLPMTALAAETGEGSGLYLRLDAGGAVSNSVGGDIFRGTGFGNDFGSSFAADIGIGAAVPVRVPGLAFRGDAMVGYLPSLGADHNAQSSAGTLGVHTSISVWTGMANAYADIGTGSPWTPFVGFGVGVASVDLSRLNYTLRGVSNASESGTTRTNFAWSAMAGLGYKITPSLTSEIGYRYLDAGTVRSSGAVTLFNGVTVSQPPLQNELTVHEFTVGLRYAF